MTTTTKQKGAIPRDFDALSIGVASPERILDWSYGEVTKPETINYRTQRPEKNGLFDEKIFGPERDHECYCGKYRGIRFKGVVCEKCGVEVTRAIVRRERMGHIDLATPVAHIWFLRGIPSRIALLLGISATDVEKVVYFASYIVTKVLPGEKERLLKDLESELGAKMQSAKKEERVRLKDLATQAKRDIESIQEGVVLDEAKYHTFAVKYGAAFEAAIGAEALYEILKKLDLPKFVTTLEGRIEKAPAAERDKLKKRIAFAQGLIKSDVRPEWMFFTRLPVIPPQLRPMVALEGGRHASSDLNDLYRRIINRNNRLKKLVAIHAPDVILRNEKRILQEAVDALIDNSMRRGGGASSILGGRRRTLKSLADYLKGKQGYFRQNLLAKRVDYSGRSVIVVGPDLKLDQCGLPKHMALELFRPFVIAGLLAQELAYNIRGAGRMIEDGDPEVWAILEEVIKGKHVLLNRAPTLHRQGFQAFQPVLIEGNAIQVHPLVCAAYNADFDGDQMAVHVPLSEEAQLEAAQIMSANKNIIKPGDGQVVTNAQQDIILGCFWMTQVIEGAQGEGKAFPSTNAAITAWDYNDVDFRAKILVLPSDHEKYAHFEGKPFETTVGRLLFNSVLPSDFPYLNEEITKKRMGRLINELVHVYSLERIPSILDKIKAFGFKYSTHAGMTFSFSDVVTPPEKAGFVKEGREAIAELKNQYEEGLLTEDERRRLALETWARISDKIKKALVAGLDPKSPVHNMIISGARGSEGQLHQMAGMKGLITNPKGETIEFPIVSSMKEGMSPIEYFISTHGSRKGMADTALNTATAGYLTRKLFDVSQDVIVLEETCGTREGLTILRPEVGALGANFAELIAGRVLLDPIVDAEGKEVFPKGHLLSHIDAEAVEETTAKEAVVRSPMSCKTLRGVCQKCYGHDLTTGHLVEKGEAVGVVAAQAIGEPGTQLTMRTFHSGGVAAEGGDITMGLPRVIELVERRKPKIPATIAHVDGVITSIEKDGSETLITVLPENKSRAKRDTEYRVHPARRILVKEGQSVTIGQVMTDGSADPSELFTYAGRAATQDYIIDEMIRIYELQGVSTARKHLEIVIKQMFSRVEIVSAGDTEFAIGSTVEMAALEEANRVMKQEGKAEAKGKVKILGITEVSLSRKSFLSTISFQHVVRKLIDASTSGAVDPLKGLKENVILGRLIPAGTGFEGSAKKKMMDDLQAQFVDERDED